jgi:hypothetical protein
VFNTEIEIFDVKIKEGMDKLILDLLPKDSSHFITIEFSDRVSDFNFIAGKAIAEKSFIDAHELSGDHSFRKIFNKFNKNS